MEKTPCSLQCHVSNPWYASIFRIGLNLNLLKYPTLAMHRYNLLTELESTKLVLKLLDSHSQEDWTTCVMRFTASVIYAIVYGKRLEDGSTDFDEIIAITTSFVKDCYPGAHLVDTFTFLDSLPDFLAPWRKEALRKRDWEMSVSRVLI